MNIKQYDHLSNSNYLQLSVKLAKVKEKSEYHDQGREKALDTET